MINRYTIVLAFIGLLVTIIGIIINYKEPTKIEPYFKITLVIEIVVAAIAIIP